jgi:NitT/TauT family transport system substrate-binding protein
VLGGPHTFNLVWATSKFANANPKIIAAFVSALDEVMKDIAADPAGAAALWVKAENSKLPAAYVEKLLRLPENEWTLVPKKVMTYAEFMGRVKVIAEPPPRWQDFFFQDIHGLPGS